MLSLFSLRATAAQVLAMAVVESFPGVLLIEAASSSVGFWADFTFPFFFHKEMLPLIEERMRFIIKERRPIKKLEMVPFSAKELLKSKRQHFRAEQAAESDTTLVDIVQIGEWTDLCFDSLLAHTGEIAAFKMQEVEQKDGCTRLSGTAFFEKEELKKYLKKLRDYESHGALGKKKKLFTLQKEGVFWHGEGEKWRFRLLNFWRKEHEKEGFEFLETPAETEPQISFFHCQFFSSHGGRRLAECKTISGHNAQEEGLFAAARCLVDRAHLFCEEESLLEEIISSLQFILKIPKIFGLKYQVVLCFAGLDREGLFREALFRLECAHEMEKAAFSGIELRIEDGLGRYWPGPFIKLEKNKIGTSRVLVRSTFGSLERWIACSLEQLQERAIFYYTADS